MKYIKCIHPSLEISVRDVGKDLCRVGPGLALSWQEEKQCSKSDADQSNQKPFHVGVPLKIDL